MTMEFMKDKCCANCFWCFTEYDENELEGYKENDSNKPQAGDCTIGMDHGKKFLCEKHDYLDNDISTQKVYKKENK